jgi:hypothetical protein
VIIGDHACDISRHEFSTPPVDDGRDLLVTHDAPSRTVRDRCSAGFRPLACPLQARSYWTSPPSVSAVAWGAARVVFVARVPIGVKELHLARKGLRQWVSDALLSG